MARTHGSVAQRSRTPPSFLDVVAVLLLAALGIWYPLARHAGLGTVLGVLVAGVVVASPVILLRGSVRLPALLVAFFGGMVLWDQIVGFHVVPTWWCGLLAGALIGADVQWFAQRRNRD